MQGGNQLEVAPCSKLTKQLRYFATPKGKEAYARSIKNFNSKHPDYYKEKHIENPKKRWLYQIKRRCKVSGWGFILTEKDIVIPEYCPYLGIKLTIGGNKQKDSTASIDRIDNSKGYLPGNVQVISWLANRMKTNASNEQLILFAQGILKLHKLEIK